MQANDTTTATADDFLTTIRASDNTKRCYGNTLRLFMREYDHLPNSSEEAQAFIATREAKGLKPATVGLDIAAMQRFLKWRGLPTHRLERLPVLLQAPRYLSKAEIKTLLDGCETPLTRCVVALLYDSGARIGEILALRMNDIDWRGFLTITRKGGRKDAANVSSWGMQYLRDWVNQATGSSPRLFGWYNYNSIYRLLKRAAARAGIAEFHPHMLRHSRAVHLRQDGLSWEEIGYHLGHVNASTTINVYARTSAFDRQRTIPAVNLDTEVAAPNG